jgi:caffeoyl-CoA O-methyltransferase
LHGHSAKQEALQNFKEAGLSEYIDARLTDAHELVKVLKGPFDFVFSDADKDWYKNYFIDVDPKLKVGGCYTTHNISDRSMGGYGRNGGRGGNGGSGDYLEYVRSLKNYETTLVNGTLVSYKKGEK